MNEQMDTGWHLKKEVNLAHIISSIMLAIALAGYVTRTETRFVKLEDAILVQKERDAKQDEFNREILTRIDNRLDRIENKLENK